MIQVFFGLRKLSLIQNFVIRTQIFRQGPLRPRIVELGLELGQGITGVKSYEKQKYKLAGGQGIPYYGEGSADQGHPGQ